MKKIENLWQEAGIEQPLSLDGCPVRLNGKNRVNIVALGDVGTTVLMGLRLLGGDCISSIGIWDLSEANMRRLEQEMNQICYPFGQAELPEIRLITREELFSCDVFVFCASKGVPALGAEGDVRMAQLSANSELIREYGRLAAQSGYRGLVAVVSDPVDPLCRAFLDSAGCHAWQVQGYGLGVMNARALYYGKKNPRFARYVREGRAFGPHGEDLVIADSIEDYDDAVSRELTKLTVNANMQVRELGYKPYIAPALSSAAISIILTMRGQWHYSSLYLGDREKGAFLGIKNRMTEEGSRYEDLPLCDSLYRRIKNAYLNLCGMER